MFKPVGSDIDDNTFIRFTESRSTHFCRFALLPDDMLAKEKLRRPMKPHLLFSSNYDGTLEAYLSELRDIIDPAFFDELWNCCADYNGDFEAFVRRNNHEPGAFYIAFPDETVRDVRRKYRARLELQERLDDPVEARQFLQSIQVRHPGVLEKLKDGFQGLLGELLGPPIRWALDNHIFPEHYDNVDPYSGLKAQIQRIKQPYNQAVRHMAEYEDKMVQNQMNILSEVKPGQLDRLNRKLWWIKLAAQNSPPGQLSGISTIHFARWVVFDEGRRMVFLSNYDGTWENYISDFIRKVAGGMDAIWNNTIDFPAGGPHDVAAFQQHIREHQIRSLAFYSAYPRLTVSNRVANRTAHDLLSGEVAADKLQAALRTL
jgi:hypothetical protein